MLLSLGRTVAACGKISHKHHLVPKIGSIFLGVLFSFLVIIHLKNR